jgi:hypothetical protein
MVHHIQGCTLKDRNMEKESINGLMAAGTMGNGRTTRLMERVFVL